MKKNIIKLVCSQHGEQEFSAFLNHAHITLKCGCTWYAGGGELKFDRTLPHREMWWEQSQAERIHYSNCATEKCKRQVVDFYRGDYWCAVDLKRVKKYYEEVLV